MLSSISNLISDKMTKYTLVYFDARGRAEPIRWIFEYSGVAYEDQRVTRDQWTSSIKPKAPMGQAPFLEVDGKALPQSLAICRYLGRKHGLAGKDDWESAQVDALVDYIEDAMKPLRAIYMAKDEAEKVALRQTYANEQSVPFLQGLERKLGENNNGEGFFVGTKPTWGDFVVVVFLDNVVSWVGTALDNYPLLKAHSQRVHELKGIKEWLARRPVTQM